MRANEAAEIGLWAIGVFVCLSLYVGGGVGWHYHTQGEITHPHVAHWKQIGGLVKDGFAFAKAKHAGTEFTPGRPVDEEKAPLNGKEQQQTYSATASGKTDPENPVEKPEAKPKKKKKKKKKTKTAVTDGEAKE